MHQMLVDQAAAAIRSRFPHRPRIGLILGTGLGNLAAELEVECRIPYADVPHFPRSTAMAHKGELLCGTMGRVTVVVMAGRCHLYEGYDLDTLMFPVRVLNALGVECLIVTNAAGGLNPGFQVGDVMVLEGHINLMFPRRQQPASKRITRTPWYDRELQKQSLATARRDNFVLQRGVYVGVQGPNYETRAEYRAFRRLGGDVVGMSTIPEVLCARELGLRVLALSTVTNIAHPDAPQTVTAEEVVAMAGRAEPLVRRIVLGVVQRWT